MAGVKQIIDSFESIEGARRGAIPYTWLQGRTSYAGLSAALALWAAQNSDPDLPRLRLALIAFIGPMSGEIVIRASRLRRGRNTAFIQLDIESGRASACAQPLCSRAPSNRGSVTRLEAPPIIPFPLPTSGRSGATPQCLLPSTSNCSTDATRQSAPPNGYAGSD